jgi:hypothetical protein
MRSVHRFVATAGFICGLTGGFWKGIAQAPAASSVVAPSAARQLGTVKAVSADGLTLTTDSGSQVSVAVAAGVRIVQLEPGSTDLKTATPISLTDISAGDRILVTGKPGDVAGTVIASRVILMKGAAIAERRQAERADWQKRGMGGIVTAVDPAGVVTISAGAKKVRVQTTPQTVFRRYAGDSVKFEDARPGTLAEIQTGDQLEVRGAKSEDGTSIQAEELVSGSFRNLSGTLASVNAATGTVTLRDLSTKKMMTVTVTANSDLRKLPPEIAARFAARQRGGSEGSGAGSAPGARGSVAPSANAGSVSSPGGSPGTGRPAGTVRRAPQAERRATAGGWGALQARRAWTSRRC